MSESKMNLEFDKAMMLLRMETKEKENRNKTPIVSPDVVETADFLFSQTLQNEGDSGDLLLARRKNNRDDQYLVKHAFSDCACNEFIYTKLALAMGYSMPKAVLFRLSPEEKRSYFKTEYIIGERYLNVIDSKPTYERIRELAQNWEQYFAFHGLYSLTGENDGVELLLADDNKIYRVDTTDAFPLSNWLLDVAGINQELEGFNPYIETKKQLLGADFSNVLNVSMCDWCLESCAKIDDNANRYFLEPFARIQEISGEYIDDFLNTLCYFYPDFIGDYFKLYISALQKQCRDYWKEKRMKV